MAGINNKMKVKRKMSPNLYTEEEMTKCIFCGKKATHIYPDLKSLNWYFGDVPVDYKCGTTKLIKKSLTKLKQEVKRK